MTSKISVSPARSRINELFMHADEQFKQYPQLSKRYVMLARKIAMRHRVRFTKEQKMQFCKKCNAYLRQGANARVRLEKNKKIALTCLECKFVRRFGYSKKVVKK